MMGQKDCCSVVGLSFLSSSVTGVNVHFRYACHRGCRPDNNLFNLEQSQETPFLHSFPTLLCSEKKNHVLLFAFFFLRFWGERIWIARCKLRITLFVVVFYFVVETSIALGVAKYSSFELSNLFAVVS